MSDTEEVNNLVQLALAEFGDAWYRDNVNYAWLHAHRPETRDRPRPKKKWGTQIYQLEHDVRKALTALRPPPETPVRSYKSRSPRRDTEARHVEPPNASQFSQSIGSSGSEGPSQLQVIVDRLMANTAAELPCDSADKKSWTAEPHAPLETLDMDS